MYDGTIREYQEGYHGLSQFIQMNQSGFKAETEFNSESECQHTYDNEVYRHLQNKQIKLSQMP